ncbi:ElyC/SanA/YdcF family protein [Candidatus Villigracilis saccharophilus]|uniref:SanA/YdcF family protein n=1 Tax=Candidatus Villigracilis saccharophilus TaxID=3140684 RepID=UPI003134CB28|nr:YdcF family protein [Anaerolineales bacterium]
MLKKIIKFSTRFALILSLLVLFGLLFPKLIVWLFASPRIFTKEGVPAGRVAIVFGAGLRYDGTPTAILRDRVQTAVQLYQLGKVNKLLMSGDNRVVDYNEPEAMRQYALGLGIPDEDIVLDYAGRRTYDTCYRASAIFQVNTAVLITQDFHLPRAIFLCNWFGVESVGVESNNNYYRKISHFIWNTRELFATSQAVWDVYALKPVPVLGEPEPIH